MKLSYSVDNLGKLLLYILGRQPDEFGLVPDADGYVRIKRLIQALAEEPGWRHVRLHQIREVAYTSRIPTVEINNNRIRAKDRSHLFWPEIPDTLPKLLYYPVRQRAYPVVLEKGLQSIATGFRIILAEDMAMAQRLGRRIDRSAIIVTVKSEHARNHGATLWRFGKQLYLSDCLPLGSFYGPPLPKKRPETKPADLPKPPVKAKTPGSYFLDMTSEPTAAARPQKKSLQRKNEWKRDRKRKRLKFKYR
jgi:putative RNA 2'-phosphotransferase